MTKRKKLQELTIKDNFMFGAVMVDEELCREFLELALEFKIARVTVSKEKSIVYHPEYKGVRLDMVADDENRTHYNVEMQVLRKKHLGKRSRYYHSQIDMELLLAGLEYGQLPDSYVIFVCDFDPFYKKRYRYTFDTVCKEDDTVCLEDGNHTVFLSTCGENEKEVPGGLVKFLKYVKAGLVQRILSNWQFDLTIFLIALLPKPRRSHRYACVWEAALSKKYSASNYPKLNFRCTSLCM